MIYPARRFGHLPLFMMAVIAFTLATPKPAEAANDRTLRYALLSSGVVFVGGLLLLIETSYSGGSNYSGDVENQEHSLQLPVITYKKEAALKNHHSVDVRLAPSVDPKGEIIEFKGTLLQLKGTKKAAVCNPILEVKEVNKNLLKDIHDQCNAWFSRNNMVFPHEVSGIDLAEAFNVALPEMVYRANILTLTPYQVALNPNHKEATKEDMSYFSIAMSDFEPNQYFKTCYHYPRNAGMNPPMIDSAGELVFKLPKQGVTHLHHDGHNEYFIATRLSSSQAKFAYAWKLGSPWPPMPRPVRLTPATKDILPIHVLDHE
ncbi:hypothetical protein [Endozoicomonas sp. ALC020]|uniref:hypothetical protein n=1 Tax=unclassified Endozoicomonas TaxID=2644528 RepID=UPI003BAF70EF